MNDTTYMYYTICGICKHDGCARAKSIINSIKFFTILKSDYDRTWYKLNGTNYILIYVHSEDPFIHMITKKDHYWVSEYTITSAGPIIPYYDLILFENVFQDVHHETQEALVFHMDFFR